MSYNRNVRYEMSNQTSYTYNKRKAYGMENNIGITKEIDRNGRLVIPKEMRELFDFENTVELIVTADGVLVRNPEYILTKKPQVE